MFEHLDKNKKNNYITRFLETILFLVEAIHAICFTYPVMQTLFNPLL